MISTPRLGSEEPLRFCSFDLTYIDEPRVGCIRVLWPPVIAFECYSSTTI
jgi:hypothetical protein